MASTRHSYISSIEHVEVWFRQQGVPKWKLLRGFHDKTRGKATICTQEEEGLDMDESWGLLQQMLHINSASGGQFTVFVPTVNNGQGETIFVQIGDIPTPGYAGLGGVPGAALQGFVSKSDVEEMLRKEKQLWMLERRVQDMEAAAGANAEWTDVLKEKLQEVDFTPVIAGLMQMITPKGVTLQGTQAEYAPPAGGDEPEGYIYDGERLMPILDDIRKNFEDDNSFLIFLGRLRDTFLKNPDMYKKMFHG